MPKASHKSDAVDHNLPSKPSTVVVGTATTATTTIELPENSRIVQPSYLEKNTGKKDLVRRLRNLVHVLRDDDENEVVVEVDSPEWPGLNATANLLVTSTYLHHADKDVRLYTVLACIEILTIYAPDVPWEEHEIIDIFSQFTRQLANLANIAENDPTLPHYTHMLEVLANVRIGCILVDLVNQHSDQPVSLTDDEDDDDDHEDSDIVHPLRKKNASTVSSMDALVDLLSTLLHGVRREHPAEILSLVPQAISACLCDYHPAQGGIPFPIPILDVLLKCIGQGPTQFIIVPAASSSTNTNEGKNSKARGKNAASPSSAAIQQLEVPNPTYQVAAQVIRSLLNRIAQPISQLLNGLLNGEPFYTDQSSIRCILAVNASDMDIDPPDSAKKSKHNGKNSTTTSAITKKFQVDWKTDENNEVYTIAYEFHRVAPQVLATVVGTIVHGLRSTSTIQRYGVTQFFGQLFSVQRAKYASDYASCFRDWLNRKHDIIPSIRLCVVQHCMSILQTTTTSSPEPKEESPIVDIGADQNQFDVALTVTEAIANLLSTDLSLDVRTEAIHLICDWIYQRPKGTSTSTIYPKENGLILMLLQAVASRVSSKQKQERRDAVTGLAHIYCKHFVQPNLQPVVAACVSAEKNFDDDDGIDEDVIVVSIQALHEMCDNIEVGSSIHRSKSRGNSLGRRRSNKDDENSSDFDRGYSGTNTMDLYRWIPSKVLECVYFTDSIDTEMRSRVVQIMDELLLKEPSATDKSAKQPGKSLSFAISQAIGWTSLLDSLVNEATGDTQSNSTAFKFLQQLLTRRATLQRIASRYIDARAQIREYDAGTEEAMEADARAMQILEQLASMTAPVENHKVSMDDVLASFHGAREKHIFRILATIVDPAHTSEARRRAFDELPKRTKSLGDAVSDWVKNLVKRCAMGDSLNVDVIHACVRLAQGCALSNDIGACSAFLSLVKMTVDIYPAICVPKVFDVVIDLFLECRSMTGSNKKEIIDTGVVSTVTSILSIVATVKPTHPLTDNLDRLRELENQLTHICTRDGTADQAKNAIYILAYLCYPANRATPQYTLDGYFAKILKDLTSTSRLKTVTDPREGMKVVRALSALSALADCSPTTLASSPESQTIVKFALDGILLGRDKVGANDDSEGDDTSNGGDISSQSPSSKKKHRPSTTKNVTPHFKGCLLDNESLSASCRRLCAAADFLVSHIRSTFLRQVLQTKSKTSTSTTQLPSKNQIRLFFQILIQILKDHGLPASSRDRLMCSSRQDRAALRQCAAISLLRLCDARLGLEQEMLSKSMWHTLGMSLLDEERTVRIAVMEELSALYKGCDTYGVYMDCPPKAPSLRFLSYLVLCSDGDRDLDSTNGHAANVGKVVSSTRAAAHSCIMNLRKVTEATYTHCCALGKDSEERFENHIKMLVTPEYCLPFAFHLLSHRKETPSTSERAEESCSEDEADFSGNDDVQHSSEGQMRTLRKRLKALLDSLVHTLGDRANNISFLLRMTEIIGRHYTPVDVEGFGSSEDSPHLRTSIDSTGDEIYLKRNHSKHHQQLEARLNLICSIAREILLSFVKSDINLATYPGIIQLPASLFKRSDLGTVRFSKPGQGFAKEKNEKKSRAETKSASITQKGALKSPVPQAVAPSASAKADVRVTFSPVIQYQSGSAKKIALLGPSLVPKSSTPESGQESRQRRSTRSASIQSTTSGSVDTLGTTPPVNLRTGTAADDLETSDDDIFTSTIPPRSIGSESSVERDHQGEVNRDDLLRPNFTTSSSEPTPTITQTPNTDSFIKGNASQSSTSDNSSSSSFTGSHTRKRRALSTGRAKASKVKRGGKTLSTENGQKFVSKKVTPKGSDELDFDFDEENVPIERNHGKEVKGKPTTSKTLASTSRSKTRMASRRT